MGNKTLNKVVFFVFLFTLFTSCKQSCLDVITHNNVGYWSRYWSQENPIGMIQVYSKKDSIVKNLCEDWSYCFTNSLGDIRGVKFRITNDTLFYYIDLKERGLVVMWDTIPIVSYSKDTIVVTNNKSEIAIWHRIPNKIVKKQKSLK